MYHDEDVSVSPDGDLAELIADAIARLPKDLPLPSVVAPAASSAQRMIAPASVKVGGYVVENGKLFVRLKGELIETAAAPGEFAIIAGTLLVRDALREVFRVQIDGEGDQAIRSARESLNKAYDVFVLKHGYLNMSANRRAFAQDPDSPTVLALEKWDSLKRTATKADVFHINTVRSFARPESAATLGEAVGISQNETGDVDTTRIADLLRVSVAEVEAALVENRLAFRDPKGGWVFGEFYLSGNVRRKLVEARQAAASDPCFQPNVLALEAVQPEDLDVVDINVRLGSPWLPTTDILEFIRHLLGGSKDHFYVKYIATQGHGLSGTRPKE
jgi:N12 class adenine-specific DNA methylase